LSHDGAIVPHRNLQAAPEAFLKAVAPSREGLVVAVECLFTWDGLADLCADQGMPCVLGHALDRHASPGGQAKHDPIDSPTMAALLRGGLRPQASGSPAQRRATRDLLRRRTHLMRQRAALLAHVQQTNRQCNRPEIGKQLAYQANRARVAERCSAPAVHQTLAVDLARLTSADARPKDLDRSLLDTAKPHAAHTRYR
jgi:hypothetical protein